MDATGHETEERLELYALGRLAEQDIAQVEEHLFLCEACRDTLDSTADFALAMRNELKERPEPAKKKALEWLRWPTPRFAMAGAFAIVLTAVGLYWIRPTIRVAPLTTLQLIALRGDMPSIGTARELDLTVIDAPAKGGPFRLEVVDGSGSPVWNGAPSPSPKGLEVKVRDRLSPGDYFVRLYGARGELLHEYGFRVRN